MNAIMMIATGSPQIFLFGSTIIFNGKGVKPYSKLQISHSVSKLATPFSSFAKDYILGAYVLNFLRTKLPRFSSHSSTTPAL